MSSLVTLTVLLLLAFGIMLGMVKPKRFGKFIVGLIVTPVLVGVGLTTGSAIFFSLSLMEQILFGIPACLIGLVILLRLVLPRDVWAGVVSSFLYDTLKYLFRLPFRLVRWLYLLKS